MIRRTTMATIVRRPFVAAVLLPTLALAIPAAYGDANTEVSMTPEFGRGETRANSLVLLPRGVLRKKRKVMTAESEAIRDSLAPRVGEHLCRKGYAVKVLAPDQLNADQDLQALVSHAKRRYNLLFRQGPLKREQVEKRGYTIGKEGTLLAARLGVESLIFASLLALKGDWAVFNVGVISGRTGDVEAFFSTRLAGGGADLIKRQDETIASLTTATLEDYPASAGGRGTSARAKDDAILSEAQELLGVEPSPERKVSQQSRTVLDACRQ